MLDGPVDHKTLRCQVSPSRKSNKSNILFLSQLMCRFV